MLLLLDLDNTLIDRAGAYAAWALGRFGASEVPWLVEQDRDGYRTRDELAGVIAERYSLDAAEMLVELRAGMVEQLAPDPRVDAALREVTAAGFVPVVVTNGTVAQQEAKLRRTGLDQLVAGWTISEGAGVRKPDRRIFEIAAASVGADLAEGGWMVGDHPAYDIGGGLAAGLRTAWVSAGRAWPADVAYRPTVTGVDCVSALRALAVA
ncbi:HAD family hydrolase [Actinoplanes sp. TRM 88003]|uniref:HAD family hydrolase n=1 Tax=Paractinoplanes aksuensis TaxID=2939490 RepID=A0ABT1DZV2_9ACTN|nr:HAD family hydrolase [Actinoplanes aksuensis]MCO8276421.1 HAD family hydrolase [Actinoplanes aksuensis]